MLHHLVKLGLDVELWVFRLDTLQLDGHLLSGGDVGSYRGHGQKRGETMMIWQLQSTVYYIQ